MGGKGFSARKAAECIQTPIWALGSGSLETDNVVWMKPGIEAPMHRA